MRLGIDLDGVVADFNLGWMTRFNEEFGTEYTPDLVTYWGAMLDLTPFHTLDTFWEWAKSGDGPGLFGTLPVYDGALEALHRLEQDHDIVIITTKPRWAHSETLVWIGEHQIPTQEVHITDEKWRVDCDIYLDDGPHNLESLVVQRPDRTVVRFVRPWNEPVEGCVDVDSWDTFEALLNQRFC